ncbi:hypothetical protein Tco_0636230 [Tanacetum coccineum]
MFPSKRKFRWGIIRSTGIKHFIDPISGYKIWRTNCKCRIPIDLYLCKVEESMIMKKVGDQTIGVIRRKKIDKEGNVSRFQEYHTSDEEEEEFSEHPSYNKYRNMVQIRQPNNPPDVTKIIAQQLQNIIPNIVTQVTNNLNNGNGNGNGGGNNGCTYKGFVTCGPQDFDRTARGRDAANAMAWDDFKALLTTEFYPSNKIEKLEGELWNHSMVGADHAGYTDRFHELAK